MKILINLIIIAFSLFIALIIAIFIFAYHSTDYCMEDGVCVEGYVYLDKAITEEYCKELEGTWYINKKRNYCQLQY